MYLNVQDCRYLDGGEDGSDVISRAPPVLQDVQADVAAGVDVRVEDPVGELDDGCFVRVVLVKVQAEPEDTVGERCVGRASI